MGSTGRCSGDREFLLNTQDFSGLSRLVHSQSGRRQSIDPNHRRIATLQLRTGAQTAPRS